LRGVAANGGEFRVAKFVEGEAFLSGRALKIEFKQLFF